jgi:hypothetical protein
MQGWGRSLTRSAPLPLAAMLLAGCVTLGGAIPSPLRCAEVSENAVKFINWAKVPEVDINIRHGEFNPMVLRLRQGWPYVLRIRNRDHEGRVFNAFDFFRNVAVIKTTVAGVDDDITCMASITVPPRETVELRLVAVTDGYYEYEDSLIPWPGVISSGPNGVIVVEERKPRI